MVVGRRSALVAAATALAAVAVAAAVAGRGCRHEDDSPVGAVRALIEAAEAGYREAVFDMLGPATQARLEDSARRASELDEHRYRAADMVGLGTAPGPDVGLELVSRDGDRAVVDVVGKGGARHPLTVVRIEGRWRVELP